MPTKQELFALLCRQRISPAEDTPEGEILTELKMMVLENEFEFYYDFFREYLAA